MPDEMQNPSEAEEKNLPADEGSEKEDAIAEDDDLEMPADYQQYVAGGETCIRACSNFS